MLAKNHVDFEKDIVGPNLLQKTVKVSNRQLSKIVLNRLSYLSPALLHLVANASSKKASQALLVGVIHNSAVVGEFLRLIVAESHRQMKKQLRKADWDDFLVICEASNPSIANWADSTKAKNRANLWRILYEVGYIKSTKDPQLLPFYLYPEISTALKKEGMLRVLDCMDVCK